MNEKDNMTFNEDMEIRLVALLLGEADLNEASKLNAFLEKNSDAKSYYESIKKSLGVFKEVIPAEAKTENSEPKLSVDRRDELFNFFNLDAEAKKRKRKDFLYWSVGMAACAIFMAVVLTGMFGSMVMYESMKIEEPEFNAPPKKQIEPNKIQYKVQTKTKSKTKPRKTTVNNVSKINMPKIDVKMPSLSAKADFESVTSSATQEGFSSGGPGMSGKAVSLFKIQANDAEDFRQSEHQALAEPKKSEVQYAPKSKAISKPKSAKARRNRVNDVSGINKHRSEAELPQSLMAVASREVLGRSIAQRQSGSFASGFFSSSSRLDLSDSESEEVSYSVGGDNAEETVLRERKEVFASNKDFDGNLSNGLFGDSIQDNENLNSPVDALADANVASNGLSFNYSMPAEADDVGDGLFDDDAFADEGSLSEAEVGSRDISSLNEAISVGGKISLDLGFVSKGRKLNSVDKIASLKKQVKSKAKPSVMKRLASPARNSFERKKSEKRASKMKADVAMPSPSFVYKPIPEVAVSDSPLSTFSLNVSDVSYKLALTSFQHRQLPPKAQVRSEEFLNAFNYHDPEPKRGQPIALNWEMARSPFSHNRDLLRFSVKTAAAGREKHRPLNIVIALDNSGSMTRSDRQKMIEAAFVSLGKMLKPQDRLSVVTFSLKPELWIEGLRGDAVGQLANQVRTLIPQGGTNLETGIELAYEVARKHFIERGNNRIVLFTDGAANVGETMPISLKKLVEENRKRGIALDCFGIGWEDYNDNLLEPLTRNSDGRYSFLKDVNDVNEQFTKKIAGALNVAASNVKVQVEFNSDRVEVYRQMGYERHQLRAQDFRNNAVDAAELSAAESGNALYSIKVKAEGMGPVAIVRVRYKDPETEQYLEKSWTIPHQKKSIALQKSSAAMRLASVATVFGEWLAGNKYSLNLSLPELSALIADSKEAFPYDSEPDNLKFMLRMAQQIK